MTEQVPAWLAVPLIILLSLTALYKCYILPGFQKDRADKSVQNGTEE